MTTRDQLNEHAYQIAMALARSGRYPALVPPDWVHENHAIVAEAGVIMQPSGLLGVRIGAQGLITTSALMVRVVPWLQLGQFPIGCTEVPKVLCRVCGTVIRATANDLEMEIDAHLESYEDCTIAHWRALYLTAGWGIVTHSQALVKAWGRLYGGISMMRTARHALRRAWARYATSRNPRKPPSFHAIEPSLWIELMLANAGHADWNRVVESARKHDQEGLHWRAGGPAQYLEGLAHRYVTHRHQGKEPEQDREPWRTEVLWGKCTAPRVVPAPVVKTRSKGPVQPCSTLGSLLDQISPKP